ncbi:uncharacterized protein [Amphiura filiformis]|uniref:uncharacterized protein n=1 Tax=Amphiura filiformis TaxID=82378 RepID=UPI003B21E818
MTETQRERRKSGASSTKGGKMVRPGFEFRPGFKLQAQDFSDKWYPAKIVQVDEEDSTVLIHFDGWNSRFDEWMDYKSNRLRPAPRRETSPEKVFIVGDTVLARWSDTRYYQGKIRGVNSNGSYRVRFYDGLEKSVQAGNIREMPEELRPIVSPQGYGIGDEVLARWNDCRYYPAKILSIKKNGAFRVLFYDGIEKSVQPFNVREMSADLKAQDFFKQFKAQIKASEEKNRKREKRKREEAEAATDETSSISKEPPQRLMKRRFSPPPVAKRSRHDSMDSSKTGSSIIEDKDVSCEKEVDVSHDKEDDAQEILTDEAGQESNSEYEIHKVVLKRGIGYYINNFIYIKNRESSIGLILRCQNRNHCHARAIIKKNGKAVIKQGHMHEPPLAKNIEFCNTDPDDDTSAMLNKPSHSQDLRNISTDSVESSPGANPLSSPTTEGCVTPVIQMLTAEEVEKIKERKKHIREPLIIDSALGVLSAPKKFAAPKELIIDLDHNKYKCEVPECGKSFRKATLLEYHKKYYHIKQATSSVTTTAASKVLSRSRKRVSTSPTTSSSRRSSEETGTPAKVTRSQRSSAPSELAIISPTREPMSPPINSPAERKKSLDGKRERSGDKIPEVRVAKNPETRSPVETKAGKIPETRIPKSPETRLVRSSNGKFVKTTPECRGSRSLSAESRSSPTAEGRVRRVSAPDRTRQLSGSGVVKPPETVPEHADNEKPTETVETTGPKVGDMEGNITITKADEVVGSNNNDTNKDISKDASKDISKDASKDNIKDASKDTNNKGINNLDEAKSIDDVVIKQEPDDVKLPQESPKILETPTPVHSSKQEIKSKMALPASTEGRKEHTEVKVEKEREGKSRSERAKVKHKKKHKHKHDKGKDERSRDRHKGDRRRKSSEKTKLSDVEGAERSSLAVKEEPVESSKTEVKHEDTSSGMEGCEDIDLEEEKELINCVCGYLEEEGFMLQCERCYCWQHGCCEGVNQSTAPKHYVCTFCRHPRGERVQSKYRYDQEWFKTGKLPRYKYICQDDISDRSPSILTAHNLMADIHSIHDVLHGLQHKMIILKNPNHSELALWAHPWRSGEEWSFDGQVPFDTMDTSAQDTDLSNMDTSNLDTVPNSINTSTQSVEIMDTSNRDTDMNQMNVGVMGNEINSDISIKSAISGGGKTHPVVEAASDAPIGSMEAGQETTPEAGEPLPVANEKIATDEKPKPTDADAVVSDESKKESLPDTSAADKEESADKSDSAKEHQSSNDEAKELQSQQSTSETCDRTNADSAVKKTVEEKVTEMEVGKNETSNKPTQTGNNEEPSISTSSSFAELSQLDPTSPGGSVFGTQSLKDPKPSTSAETDGQFKLTVDDAVDIDKPGPSGLQQSIESNQPGPSDQQPPPVDADIPGPSGLQATNIPSTSADDGTELLSTAVKVTGSSVWTPVQASNSSTLPSTCGNVAAVQHPAIPPPAVCQANLMEHIQTMHEELFDRLALIEEQIEALEVAYAQKHPGTVNEPPPSSEQESLALKRKMAVLMADLEKLSNIDLNSHN